MESLFKQKLLGLRNPSVPRTFAQALMGECTWIKKTRPTTTAPKLQKDIYSEKVQMIESLERFTQEKTQEQNTSVFKFPGGEVKLKNDEEWNSNHSVTSFDSLLNELKMDSKLADIVFSKKSIGNVKVLFVGEKFRLVDEILSQAKGGFIDELLTCFPLKTAEFFERMISAMKLSPEEVMIFPIEGSDDSDFSDKAMAIVSYYKPEVVITLGAKATSKILKSNDRLSLVHGQFFTRKMNQDTSIQVVPLFHPSIIETNQNMKKTAWIDMQKIMKHLKKLP